MNKRPEQTEITKANIQQAFWSLYEKTPVASISIKEITDKAGYNRGTFYLYYTDIYDLLDQIEKRLLTDARACIAACMARLEAASTLPDDEHDAEKEAAMRDVLAFYEENRSYLTVLLGSNGDPQFVADLKEQLKPLWSRYVLKRNTADTGNTAAATETDLVLEYTLSGAIFMVSRWLENPRGVTPEKLLHIIYHSAIE